MIRPEAKALLVRYREVLAGICVGILGLWWLLGPGRLLTLPAIALLAMGVALVWVGLQRARFRSAGDGQGVVQVTEGQVAYLGPITGGAVSLRELSRLSLDHTTGSAEWVLHQDGQSTLRIPVNAAGSEALFDAFATLPRLQTGRMLDVLNHPIGGHTVIWQRDPSTNAQLPLH
ncbi:MAG: hypothetical protein AB8B58_01620 [Roseobacter sp.]